MIRQCLEGIFARRLEDVFKISWRCLSKTSWRGLQNVLETSWRCLEDVFARRSLPMLFPLPLYPCLNPPLRVSGNTIIVKLTGKSFKIWYSFEVQFFASLLQCVSVTYFFTRNLFESNNMCFKVILKLFCFIFYLYYFKVRSRWKITNHFGILPLL